jgi:hypothetical protein
MLTITLIITLTNKALRFTAAGPSTIAENITGGSFTTPSQATA